MAWTEDFGQGFLMPFKYTYDKFAKVDKVADTILDKGNDVASNLLDLLGGNSNILIYLGIGLVAVLVLPTIIEKAL